MGTLFWFLSILVFIFLEVVTSALISIWFAFAALVVMLMSFFITNVFLEFTIFVIFSIIFLVMTKVFYSKKIKTDIVKTNVYSIIGNEYILKDGVDKNKFGKIKINDEVWNVTSNQEICAGETVIVENIVGTKLIVRKKD